jgi:hypothetical protein
MLERQEIIGHLTRLLKSELLGGSPSLAKLLTFCVNTTLAGEEESLKETTIGVLCFGRSATYDTKADPIVRVNARRLRRKLELFYEAEGREEKVRISLPKGSYIARFHRREEAIAPAAVTIQTDPIVDLEIPLASVVAVHKSGWRGYRSLSLAALLFIVIAVASVAFIGSHRAGTNRPQESAQEPIPPVASVSHTKADVVLSPDGERVAFSSDGNQSGVPRIYLQSRGSDSPTLLTQTPYPEVQPVWSVDGKTITLLREIEPTLYQLVRVDIATRNEDILRSIQLSADRERQSQEDEGITARGRDRDGSTRFKRQGKLAPLKLPKKMDSPPNGQRAVPEDVSYNMLNAFEPRL